MALHCVVPLEDLVANGASDDGPLTSAVLGPQMPLEDGATSEQLVAHGTDELLRVHLEMLFQIRAALELSPALLAWEVPLVMPISVSGQFDVRPKLRVAYLAFVFDATGVDSKVSLHVRVTRKHLLADTTFSAGGVALYICNGTRRGHLGVFSNLPFVGSFEFQYLVFIIEKITIFCW